MTATNHMLTGALIAVTVQRPELAIPLAFVSHFALDAIPHFGFEEDDVVVRNGMKLFRTVMSIDIAACISALIVLPTVAHLTHMAVRPWAVATCMLAAYSPDLIWLYRYVREMREKRPQPKGKFARFHQKIQWSETLHGMHAEFVWGGLMLLLFSALS